MAKSDDKSRLPDILAFSGVFGMASIFGLYLKSVILQRTSGYLAISRHLGRSGAEDFNWMERVSFYREDIVIWGVSSVVFAIFVSLFPRRLRPWILAGLATLVVFYYFISLMTFANVGAFITLPLASDGIRWLIEHPNDLATYLSVSALMKLSLLLILLLGFVYSAYGAGEKMGAIARRVIGRGYLLGAVIAVGLVLVGAQNTVDAAPAYKSATRASLTALLYKSSGSGKFSNEDLPTLGVSYRDVSRTPGIPEKDQLFGVAANKDVLLFILETAPLEAHDPDKEVFLSYLPDGVLISEEHYSTYPYTSDAMFSIFASAYPVERNRLLNSENGISSLGWLNLLRKNGYVTKHYSPFGDTFENDTALFKDSGFEQRYIPPKFSGAGGGPDGREARNILDRFSARDVREDGHVMSLLASDLNAWENLKADVLAWKSKDERFAVAFAPQIGHGPWPKLVESESVLAQGKALVSLQMEWLREFVKILEQQGYLKNTILVVTGDHGLRTKTEFPELEGGVLSEISINVPFALYASGVFPGRMNLPHPTSHVDIGPSILWLLGVEDTRPAIHGYPMWAQSLSERKVFAFGRDYLGADAVIHKSNLVSCSSLSEQCQRLRGKGGVDSNALSEKDAVDSKSRIQNMEEIQHRMTELLIANAR